MSLHNDIMNISANTVNASLAGYTDDEFKAYKYGHRDARHEAAEMALEQGERISSLMNFLQDIADDQYSCLNDLEKTTRRFLAEMSSVK